MAKSHYVEAKCNADAPSDIGRQGLLLLDRFEVGDVLGAGAFSEVYSALDRKTGKCVAVKIQDDISKTFFLEEVETMERLQGLPYVPALLGYASEPIMFIAMDKLLHSLNEFETNPLSLPASILVSLECFHAVRSVHSRGVVHRDIKPHNVGIGLNSNGGYQIYLIDYGLGRVVVSEDGSVVPPRQLPGFVGTDRYASANAHEEKELGQSDDLISLFYTILELFNGVLPWKSAPTRDGIGNLKRATSLSDLCSGLPVAIRQFGDAVVGLGIAHVRTELRPLHYLINLAIPTFIVSVVSNVGFFTPTTTGGERIEKVNLGLTTLLAYSVLLMMVSDNVPSTSSTVPLIGWYLLWTIVQTSAATIMSSIILVINKKGNDGKPVPDSVHRFFFGWLNRYLKVKRPNETHDYDYDDACEQDAPVLTRYKPRRQSNVFGKIYFGHNGSTSRRQSLAAPLEGSCINSVITPLVTITDPEGNKNGPQSSLANGNAFAFLNKHVINEVKEPEYDSIEIEWEWLACILDRLCLTLSLLSLLLFVMGHYRWVHCWQVLLIRVLYDTYTCACELYIFEFPCENVCA